jgi:coatomer subunit beta
MAASVEKSCTMLVLNDRAGSASEIKEALEGANVEAKIDAMQRAVMMLLAGEQLPQLFITIVRYVLPSEDHTLQKLLLLYLVSCPPCTHLFLPVGTRHQRSSGVWTLPRH